jgi:hypothetical protein
MSIRAGTPMKFWLLFSLLILSFRADAESIRPIPVELEELQSRGFSALYNLKHDEAIKQFQMMVAKDSRHPAGYVYLGSALWLQELTRLRRIQTQLYNRGNAFFRQREKPVVDPALEKSF